MRPIYTALCDGFVSLFHADESIISCLFTLVIISWQAVEIMIAVNII
jgi:hypothetical protein